MVREAATKSVPGRFFLHLCDWEYISRIQTEKDGAVGAISPTKATGAAVQNVLIETGKCIPCTRDT